MLTGVALAASPAHAQDLFELEVFPYRTVDRGATEIELHTNVLTRRGPDVEEGGASHHPFHLSVEVTHGWTEYFETGVFIETAPFATRGGARFAGGHVRPRVRFPDMPAFPFDVSLSVEYALARAAFDPSGQHLEIRPILARQDGRLYVSLNPTIGFVFQGPEAGSGPGFGIATKTSWQIAGPAAAGVEFYWETEAIRHFDPDTERHYFIIPTLDLELARGWEVNLGAGHCPTWNGEPWVIKAVLGRSFSF